MVAHRKLPKIQWPKKAIVLAIPLMLTLGACDGELAQTPSPDPSPSSEVSPNDGGTSPSPAEPSPSVNNGSTQEPALPTENAQVKIYWLTQKDTELGLVASDYQINNEDLSDGDKLTQSVKRLLQGPANTNVSSAIPEGTTLNSLKLKTDGVHLDLSKTFTTGGGSQSMQGRLGQIIYTASSLDSNAPIWISVEGEALKVLGGEGVEVSQPITRKEFDDNFSL